MAGRSAQRPTPSRNRSSRRRAAPGAGGAGNRAPSRRRRAAPTRGRRRCGSGATRRPPRWRSRGRSRRRTRSGPRPRRGRRGRPARASRRICRRTAWATASAVSRVSSPAGGAPVRPTAAKSSLTSRDTTPRRNTFSAPGRGPMRAAICPLVNVSAMASVPWRLASSASTTPSSVLSSSREDEVAEALAHLALDRRELLADVVHVGAAHGQLGLELRIVRAEAELHAAVRHHLLHAGEERVHVRLAEPVGVEPLEMDHRLHAALGEDPRDHLLLEHAPQLARDARREEEAGAADVEREAARGADRIVDHLRGGGQHGLLHVVGRHDAAAPLEEVLHPGEPLLVQRELDPRRLRRDLLRQVVHRRPQAAVDDDRIRALSGELEGQQQALAIVADRRLPLHREPDVLELLAHVAEVGVDDLARQHLVARADDLDAHGPPFRKQALEPRSGRDAIIRRRAGRLMPVAGRARRACGTTPGLAAGAVAAMV